jgi:hypothetical protein
MLTAQLAKSMDDEHLLASARAEIGALANDAGDFFTRLNDLVTTNQE